MLKLIYFLRFFDLLKKRANQPKFANLYAYTKAQQQIHIRRFFSFACCFPLSRVNQKQFRFIVEICLPARKKNLKYGEKIIELSSLCDIKRARVLSIISIGVPFFPRSFLILLALSIYVCIWHQFVLYEISDTARTSYTLCARFQFSKNKFIILFIRHTKFGYIMFCCVFFFAAALTWFYCWSLFFLHRAATMFLHWSRCAPFCQRAKDFFFVDLSSLHTDAQQKQAESLHNISKADQKLKEMEKSQTSSVLPLTCVYCAVQNSEIA